MLSASDGKSITVDELPLFRRNIEKGETQRELGDKQLFLAYNSYIKSEM